jgi:hypothetical protein
MDNPPHGHFGYGILTFRINCVFRTEPRYDLLVQGPVNRPKDGIAGLTGVIETDWAPYTFTMNWLFTRVDHPVRFLKGEPICHFFPILRGSLETVEPELKAISEDAELNQVHTDWKAKRDRIIADLELRGSEVPTQKWQKHYYRGLWPDEERKGAKDHRVHIRLKPFSRTPPR